MSDDLVIPHPREARRLVGHAAAVDALSRQLASGRPHHAWLLSGPRGVGKATLAYLAAKHLLTGGTDRMSGAGGLRHAPEGAAAAQVANGAAPSLFIYERRVNQKTGRLLTDIDVAQVRSHTQRLHLHAAGGAWRIAIVDSVDELNPSSANALLKILEEPPKKTLFFLINHARGQTLATIRSRCASLHLEGLDDAEMGGVFEALDLGLPAADAALLGQLAGGSPGRALMLAGADGAALYRDMIGLLGAMPRGDVPRMHKLGDKLARDRTAEMFRTFGDLLTEWIGRAVRHTAGAEASAGVAAAAPVERVPGEGAILARWRDTVGLERGPALWDKVSVLFRRGNAANLDRKQTLLDAMYSIQQAMRGA